MYEELVTDNWYATYYKMIPNNPIASYTIHKNPNELKDLNLKNIKV